MKFDDPRCGRASRWFVSTGMLIIETRSGMTPLGERAFLQQGPANVRIAGDPNDTNAPTYSSLGGVTAQLPGDRSGQIPAETIDRAGRVGTHRGPARPETRLAHFASESGHNIPQVFWDYLNAR